MNLLTLSVYNVIITVSNYVVQKNIVGRKDMKKKITFLSIFIIMILVAIPVGVYAFAQGNIIQNKNNVTGVTDSGVELPQMGEDYVSEEFAMPDLRELEKQWYEYIEFDTDSTDYIEGKTTVRCYMPLDYSQSTVMTYKPLSMTTAGKSGNILGQTQSIASGDYTTASSVTVNYSVSSSFSLGFNESLTVGMTIGTELGAGASATASAGLVSATTSIESKVKYDVSTQLGFQSNQTMQTSETQSISRTFEKIDEIDTPWRIVQYYVQVPVKIEVYKKGVQSILDSGYFLINIMTGTCRQWADGTIEHWQTGERVTIENFESDFCTADAIKKRERQDWN